MFHMKIQDLFSSKDKNEKLKCCLLQFLFGALKVKSLITVPDLDQNCFNLQVCKLHTDESSGNQI